MAREIETLFGTVEVEEPKETKSFNKKDTKSGKTEWLTPPDVFQPLGGFDLDPCAPINPPWLIAKNQFTIADNGFIREWFGRVWMNPPYTTDTHRWMRKLAEHGNGIALIFARTETKAFFPWVWDYADGIFFFNKRLTFYHVTGQKAEDSSDAPSVLVAYGKNNVEAIEKSGLKGKLIYL